MTTTPSVGLSFQARVQPWMLECFGAEIAADELERGDRFLEESLELLQAKGYPRERVRALEEYVYSRPAGEPSQEVGGVMVTLAALCLAAGLDMHEAGETELARILQPESVAKIRRKQAAKPTGSALPVGRPVSAPAPEVGSLIEKLRKVADDGGVSGYWPNVTLNKAADMLSTLSARLAEVEGERDEALDTMVEVSGFLRGYGDVAEIAANKLDAALQGAGQAEPGEGEA